MRIIGADISHWEGDIIWTEAVQYLPFVYYKATDGEDWIDAWFGSNHDECEEVGMSHAGYHWWQEEQDPIKQADHYCDTLEDVGDGYKREIIDVEPKGLVPDSALKLKRLLDRVEQRRGRKPAIYTSANYWNNYVKPNPSWTNQYDLLCAHYKYGLNPALPLGWTMDKLRIWQFTDKFWFPGCNEIADGNWFYGTLQECRNWFGNYRPYNQLPPSTLKFYALSGGLRIRSLPSINASIIGSLNAGDEIGVMNVGGQDAWIKHEQGWSACERYGVRFLEPKREDK